MKVYIYGLIDPRKPALIRYVGQTYDLRHRLGTHRNNKERSPFGDWALSLREEKIPMSYIILETVQSLGEASEREAFWIEQHSSPHLFNSPSASTVVKRMAQALENPTEENPALEVIEKEMLVYALSRCRGDLTEIYRSNILGYSLRTIKRHLKEYNLNLDDFKYQPEHEIWAYVKSYHPRGISRRALCKEFGLQLDKRQMDDALTKLVESGKLKRSDDLFLP